MRFLILGLAAIGFLGTAPSALATDDRVFSDAPVLQLADHDASDRDDAVTREEVQRKKRELREMERELRRKERAAQRDDAYEDRRRPARPQPRAPRIWVGLGAGVGYGAADVPCTSGFFGDDCQEEGILNTYSANVTLAGAGGALRLRGIRDSDKGDDARTPYEQAAMLGTRFGRSNWYGFAGYGRFRHVDDRYPEDRASGFAWEIVFAPATESLTGLELSFQGNSGDDVDLVAFNIGLRLGALR